MEFDAYEALDWSGLVLDEAQAAKNHLSHNYACAKKLRAPFKLAVTGTPMENHLGELWSLLSITAPGLFATQRQFEQHYRRPIERGRDAERLAELRRRIRPVMLRRTKDEVAADLPEKQENVLEVELQPAAPPRLPRVAAPRAAEGARAARRPRRQPVRDPALAHAAAPGQPRHRPRRPVRCRHPVDQARRARRPARDDRCRRPPHAGVQPVHPVPAGGARAPRRGRHRATATSTARPATARR